LFNLVWLGLSFEILDIDPWVTRPWSLVDSMTRTPLARLSKVVIANSAKLREPYIFRVRPHPINDALNLQHFVDDTIIDIICKTASRAA
jgi:hypothetical protein